MFKAGWENEDARIWLTYNDPAWLVERRRLNSLSDCALNALAVRQPQ
jgi:hypothetical protein